MRGSRPLDLCQGGLSPLSLLVLQGWVALSDTRVSLDGAWGEGWSLIPWEVSDSSPLFPDVVPETPTRAPQVVLHPVTSNPM